MDSDPELMPAINELVCLLKDLPRALSSQTEIEIRLGYINEINNKYRFDPDISEDKFNKIFKALTKYPDWQDVVQENVKDYYGSDNKRLTRYDDDSSKRTCVKKTKIQDIDFEYISMDMRLSVSQEIICDPDEDWDDIVKEEDITLTRYKKRTSFYITENWRFDLTIVETEQDGLKSKSYEVELELIDYWDALVKNNYNMGWVAHKFFREIKQLMKFCEDEDVIDNMITVKNRKLRNQFSYPILEPGNIEVFPDSQHDIQE